MNIIATTLLVGALSALPTVNPPTLGNPVDGLSISAAGMNLEFGEAGIEAKAAETTDFELEIRFKSHAPIRVRL